MIGTSSRQRRMVSLGKVTAPKPVNLPSQKKENNGNDPNLNLVPKSSGWGGESTAPPTSSAGPSHEEAPSKLPPRVLPAQPGPAWGGAGLPEERQRALEIASREQFPTLGSQGSNIDRSREPHGDERREFYSEYHPRTPISGRGTWDEDERSHYSGPPIENDFRGSTHSRGGYSAGPRYGQEGHFSRYDDEMDDYRGGYGSEMRPPSPRRDYSYYPKKERFEDHDVQLIPPPPPRGRYDREYSGRFQHRYRDQVPHDYPPNSPYGNRYNERERYNRRFESANISDAEAGDGDTNFRHPISSGLTDEPPVMTEGRPSHGQVNGLKVEDEAPLDNTVRYRKSGDYDERMRYGSGPRYPQQMSAGRFSSDHRHVQGGHYVKGIRNFEEESRGPSGPVPPPPPPPPPPPRHTEEDIEESKTSPRVGKVEHSTQKDAGSVASASEEDALSSATSYSHHATAGSSIAPSTVRSDIGGNFVEEKSSIELSGMEERPYYNDGGRLNVTSPKDESHYSEANEFPMKDSYASRVSVRGEGSKNASKMMEKQQPTRILKRSGAGAGSPSFSLTNAAASNSSAAEFDSQTPHLLNLGQNFSISDKNADSGSCKIDKQSTQSENREGIFLSSLHSESPFIDRLSTSEGGEIESNKDDSHIAPSLQGLSLQPSVLLGGAGLLKSSQAEVDKTKEQQDRSVAVSSEAFQQSEPFFLPHTSTAHHIPLMTFDTNGKGNMEENITGQGPVSTSLPSMSGGHNLASLPLGFNISQGNAALGTGNQTSLIPPPLQFGDILLPSIIDGSVEPGETPPKDVSLLGRELGAAIDSARGESRQSNTTDSGRPSNKSSGAGLKAVGRKTGRQNKGDNDDRNQRQSDRNKARFVHDSDSRKGKGHRQEYYRRTNPMRSESSRVKPAPPPPPSAAPPGLVQNQESDPYGVEEHGRGLAPLQPPPPPPPARDDPHDGNTRNEENNQTIGGDENMRGNSKSEGAKPGKKTLPSQNNGGQYGNHRDGKSLTNQTHNMGDKDMPLEKDAKNRSTANGIGEAVETESCQNKEDKLTGTNGMHGNKSGMEQRLKRRGRGKPRGRTTSYAFTHGVHTSYPHGDHTHEDFTDNASEHKTDEGAGMKQPNPPQTSRGGFAGRRRGRGFPPRRGRGANNNSAINAKNGATTIINKAQEAKKNDAS